MTERLAYSVSEVQEVLGVGRATARRLADELGIRVSPRRILVPAVRLERWLEGGDGEVGSDTGKDSVPRPVTGSRD